MWVLVNLITNSDIADLFLTKLNGYSFIINLFKQHFFDQNNYQRDRRLAQEELSLLEQLIWVISNLTADKLDGSNAKMALEFKVDKYLGMAIFDFKTQF